MDTEMNIDATMDTEVNVIFEPEKGVPFSMEVDLFDTVLEVKEKIQKHEGIPISKQTLMFNGQLLNDDVNLWNTEIQGHSRIQILLATDSDALPVATTTQEMPPPPPRPPRRIEFFVNLPSGIRMPIEMNATHTVLQLKEKILAVENVPLERMALLLHATHTELHDHQLLRDCNVSELDMRLRLSTTASLAAAEHYHSMHGSFLHHMPVDVSTTEQVLPPLPSTTIEVIVKLPLSQIEVPLEMNFHDTVLQMKEKIRLLENVPVERMVVMLRAAGTELYDHQLLRDCVVFDNSEIDVSLTPSTTASPVFVEAAAAAAALCHSLELLQQYQDSLIQLLSAPVPPTPVVTATKELPAPAPLMSFCVMMTLPSSHIGVPMEVNLDDTVLQLKEKVHLLEDAPVNRLLVRSEGTELHDHQRLGDFNVFEIEVSLRPSSPPPTASAATEAGCSCSGGGDDGGGEGSGNLKVTVVSMCGKKRIPLRVDPTDIVGETLRKELKRLHQNYEFPLPERYFFIHRRDTMDDERSFGWHNVRQGDTIEVFRGWLSPDRRDHVPRGPHRKC